MIDSLAMRLYDISTEQALLGSILLEGNKSFEELTGIINETDFYKKSHQTIFRCFSGLFRDNRGIDLVIVVEELNKINSLEDIGTIPPTAQNLIIEFEIETNFIIDGWDKKTDLEIIDKIRLGDFSYIEQTSVWDSYSEEVCEIINEEEVCETLTNRQKVRTVLSARDDKFYLSKQLITVLRRLFYS